MRTILSIDGGGIRGIIPAMILAEIEKRSGKPISQLFSMIAGTSTGGILAMGLSRPGANKAPKHTAEDMLNLYLDHGAKVFSRSLWKRFMSGEGVLDEKYDHYNLEKVFYRYYGDTMLGNALTDVLVTSYDIENRQPIFFKSWRSKWKKLEMRLAVRATTAAPTYFEPAYFSIPDVGETGLIDGGVFANNPTMAAYAEAKLIYEPDQQFMVVSLGTGEATRPIDYQDAKDWGKAGWLLPLLSVVADGVSDATDYQIRQLLGNKYYRFQTRLDKASDDIDEVTQGNMANLQTEALDMIVENSAKLDELVAALLTVDNTKLVRETELEEG